MKILQNIIDAFGVATSAVVGILPTSPFRAYIDVSLTSEQLSLINWVLPVGQIIAVTQAWLLAIALWYVLQVVLRWVKVIE